MKKGTAAQHPNLSRGQWKPWGRLIWSGAEAPVGLRKSGCAVRNPELCVSLYPVTKPALTQDHTAKKRLGSGFRVVGV